VSGSKVRRLTDTLGIVADGGGGDPAKAQTVALRPFGANAKDPHYLFR